MAKQQDYTGAHNDEALQRAVDFITSDYYQNNENGVKDDLEAHMDADYLYFIIRNTAKLKSYNRIPEEDFVYDWQDPVEFCKTTRNTNTIFNHTNTLAEAMYQVMFQCKYGALKRQYIKYRAQTGQIDEQQQLVELLAI